MSEEKVLSQEELNLLMETLGKKLEKVSEKAEPFNFEKLEKVSPYRFLRLEQFFEEFGKRVSDKLKTIVPNVKSVYLKEEKKTSAEEVIKDLKEPFVYLEAKTEVRTDFYVFLDSRISYTFISLMLGGQPAELEGKPFSRLELNLLKKITDTFCETLKNTWNEFFSIKVEECELKEILMDIDMSDEYQTFKLEFDFETVKENLYIIIPFFFLKDFKEEFSIPKMEEEEKREFINALLSIPLKIEVKLYETRKLISQVGSLLEGGILITDKKPDSEVDVYVQGKLKFKGILGETEEKRAVQISKLL